MKNKAMNKATANFKGIESKNRKLISAVRFPLKFHIPHSALRNSDFALRIQKGLPRAINQGPAPEAKPIFESAKLPIHRRTPNFNSLSFPASDSWPEASNCEAEPRIFFLLSTLDSRLSTMPRVRAFFFKGCRKCRKKKDRRQRSPEQNAPEARIQKPDDPDQQTRDFGLGTLDLTYKHGEQQHAKEN
jgi:hypothetical protein